MQETILKNGRQYRSHPVNRRNHLGRQIKKYQHLKQQCFGSAFCSLCWSASCYLPQCGSGYGSISILLPNSMFITLPNLTLCGCFKETLLGFKTHFRISTVCIWKQRLGGCFLTSSFIDRHNSPQFLRSFLKKKSKSRLSFGLELSSNLFHWY